MPVLVSLHSKVDYLSESYGIHEILLITLFSFQSPKDSEEESSVDFTEISWTV